MSEYCGLLCRMVFWRPSKINAGSFTRSLKLLVHSKKVNFLSNVDIALQHFAACLKGHEINHADDRPFQSDQCDRRFKRKQDLKLYVHKATHIGIKAFKGDRCDMKFAQNSMLIKHNTCK